MAALASDWLRHFRLLLWNRWKGIQRNLTGSKISTPSTKFVFSGRSEKQDGRPGLWLAETFSTSPLKPLNGIQRNLTGSKISTPSTKFVFFGPIGKTRWPPWPLIGWDIFDFSETASSQATVFPSSTLGSRRRTQIPWLATMLKPLNGIQRNLTGSKISTHSTKFVFFGPIGKTRWPPWRLIGLDIFDFSSERNSTKLDRKQDLKALYQVCVFFGPIGKTRWPPRPLIGWDIFDFSVKTAEQNSTKLDRKQDLNAFYQVCVFRVDRKNKMAAWPLIGWDIFDFSSETAEPNSTKLDRKQDLNALYQVCVFRADRKNKRASLASDCPRYFRLLLWNRWIEFNETW